PKSGVIIELSVSLSLFATALRSRPRKEVKAGSSASLSACSFFFSSSSFFFCFSCSAAQPEILRARARHASGRQNMCRWIFGSFGERERNFGVRLLEENVDH